MRRHPTTVLSLLAAVLFFPLLGCGGEETTTVTQSPEAKKADTAGQDAMREMMKGKAAPKPAAK